jgi:hypothetical protein
MAEDMALRGWEVMQRERKAIIFLEGISLEEDSGLIGQIGQVIQEGSRDNINR